MYQAKQSGAESVVCSEPEGAPLERLELMTRLLDYTVEETSNQVLAGSRIEPVKFEEYWTFVRPVGPNPWKLSAIQQAE